MSEIIKTEKIDFPFIREKVEIITFENGHRLVLARKRSTMVNISTWVNTGSINENEHNNGVSHFLEHLMFKGTHKYKAGDFDKTLERKGGIINAATWKDYTFYYVTIPIEHFDLALHMHADMMIDPVIPDCEIGSAFNIQKEQPKDKRERCVVIEEIRMGQDNNWRRVYNALNKNMYDKHPYRRDVIGTKEIVASISRDEIMRYYKSFYTPDNMVTVIVGDFDRRNVINKVQNEFKFQNFPEFDRLVPDEKTAEVKIKNPKTVVDYAHINTGYLMYGFLADKPSNFKETIALDLLNTILGDGKSSRLNNDLIENVDEPYVYSTGCSHYQLKDGDCFLIDINFDADKKDKVLEDINLELDNLKNIKEEEIKKAKKFAKINFAEESETVSATGEFIGELITVFGDLTFANKYLEILDEIDSSYLSKIAEKYLSKEFASISMLLPENGGK